MKPQRLRLRYRVSAAALSLGQRELIQAWEEAALAAGLDLAHSGAKRPAPLISVAARLPQGVTSDCELVDIVLNQRADPADALARLQRALPPGLETTGVREIGLKAPPVQTQLRWAEYEVEVPAAGLSPAAAQKAIERLLSADTLPWEHRRETKVRRYDLRPLVLELRLAGERDEGLVLLMRLRAEQEMTGRADQVVAALGLPLARRIHRCRLYVEETQPAVLAYRRLGEPDVL